jgi:hypothetical protein
LSRHILSKYAVCPFYQWHENNRISCEGTDAKNIIHLVFGDSKDQQAYSKRYCNDLEGCTCCKLYQMLEAKYTEPEGG